MLLRRCNLDHATDNERLSHGNASAICWAVHSAVGCAVTLKTRWVDLVCLKCDGYYQWEMGIPCDARLLCPLLLRSSERQHAAPYQFRQKCPPRSTKNHLQRRVACPPLKWLEMFFAS